MEAAAEDPSSELDTLVRALSEMAKPYGYVVGVIPGFGMMPAFRIRKPGGRWLAVMCEARSEGGDSFPDKESIAEVLVLKYGSMPAWDAYFFCEREILRFQGGSPEELTLKAAGVRAALYAR